MQLTPEIKATIREELEWARSVSSPEEAARIDTALTWLDTLAAGEVDANGLLPCPFCGTSEVRVEQDESETWWWINCDKCDITIEPFVTKSIAIAMWNRRTPAPHLASPKVQPLDMPDGPGWWAHDDSGRQQFVVHLPTFEVYPDKVRYQWGDDDHFVFVLPVATFKRTWPGKWYRVTLPWDAPQPTQERRMTMERSKVYQMIDGEREYQDAKWGTVEQNPHTVTDWLFIINHYWCKATDAHMGKQERLREIRKIAALAVAALEQYGCEPREGYAPQPDSAQDDVLANAYDLLEVVKLAYRKHHADDYAIGWDELSDKLGDVLSNAMGVESFVKWQESNYE